MSTATHVGAWDRASQSMLVSKPAAVASGWLPSLLKTLVQTQPPIRARIEVPDTRAFGSLSVRILTYPFRRFFDRLQGLNHQSRRGS
jgi:hypothetical protein